MSDPRSDIYFNHDAANRQRTGYYPTENLNVPPAQGFPLAGQYSTDMTAERHQGGSTYHEQFPPSMWTVGAAGLSGGSGRSQLDPSGVETWATSYDNSYGVPPPMPRRPPQSSPHQGNQNDLAPVFAGYPDQFYQYRSEWNIAAMAHQPQSSSSAIAGWDAEDDSFQNTSVAAAPTFEPEDDSSEALAASSSTNVVLLPTARKEKRQKASQKMHQCEMCGKEFPRPSGLRTHMNSHNDEKPFKCNYPGCDRAFSVLSNARRHYRTHGVEPPPSPSSLRAAESSSGGQFAVNFEAPVTPQSATPPTTSQEQFRVRWIEPNSRTRGAGWGMRQADYSD
ncbi:hypothetical protein MIND_00129700 [Mycena indigotica]|uniref:C2H2-type domain-containing protein n=1 Tax=Mycena indigotica TaxID=2126181 RepID=A0A8H6TEX9_9AGAR|nr:uncharacterized protein MIND_00129700 [Mycena indigotica]KAF7316116.1 hypothetical protein MIND_00129700 [Mycena indigotica]